MDTYTLEHPELGTLADFFALHPDPADVAKRLPVLRGNVEAGKVRLENVLILRSGRGVEGTALIPAAPRVPVFPRFRPGVTPGAVTVLARALRERTDPERVLLLQDDQAPLNREGVEAAGWRYGSTEVMYETDLRARSYAPIPGAIEGGEDLWQHPGVAALLTTLGRPDEEGREDWTLVALRREADEDTFVALGAYGPSRPGYGGADMIGVHPTMRGKGLGTRLHAHLLSRLAREFARHGGLTSADNRAMRRIFEKNGSRPTVTQMYFRQPSE